MNPVRSYRAHIALISRAHISPIPPRDMSAPKPAAGHANFRRKEGGGKMRASALGI